MSDLRKITLKEVEKHKDPKGESKQVWLVIHDHVYDVTKFLDEVKRDSFNIYFPCQLF